MNPVGYVNDYEQWAQDANRGQTMRLASAAATAATAAAAAAPKPAPQAVEAAQAQQLSGTQADGDRDRDRDRYHTYYYRPRSDSSVSSNYYYAWPRNNGFCYGPGYHNNPYGHEHNWFGRTASEVYNDNVAYVMHRRGMGPRRGEQEMVPRDPRDDQMFYVRELDGQWTLRSFATIENDLRPGYWSTYDGRAFFIRTHE